MTTTSPDEALHFRGKTLTPESPRPVHIPEPANIPILQNQMDPIFNDTSTYQIPQGSYSYDNNNALQQQQHQQPPVQNLGQQLEESCLSKTGAVLQNGGDNTPGPVGAAGGHPVADSFAESLLKDSDGTGKENESTFSVAHTAPLSKQLSSPVLQQPSPGDTANPELPASDQDAPAPASMNGPVTSEDPSQTLSSLHNPSTALQSNEPISDNETNGHGQQTRDNTNGAHDEGVDYQNLLDNLSPSASTAPCAPAVTATATSTAEDSLLSSPNSEKTLQSAQGLPPRPPPQDKPSIHPNYAASDNIRSFHQLPAQNPNVSSFASQQSNYPSNPGLPNMMAAAPGAPGAPSGANALPPPPVATFQQTALAQDTGQGDKMDVDISKAAFEGEGENQWGPEVQKKYDKFLHDERIYVTEGLWDRFPTQSRLFIGNLPTERVTKRDLFHLFHKYGKLAQISIKQAYGFVQFLESSACRKALQVEQGGTVRGRKIHLEISKPQRNTRNAPPPAPEPARAAPPTRRSRSRSPVDHGRSTQASRSSRTSGDRYDRPYEPPRLPFSDYRDDHPSRRRDGYRPPRSPSPRPFRGREGYRSRDRTPERYDRRDRRRSRSPPPYSRSGRYRTPSPRSRDYDSDSDLPIPRRSAREVPDVQIIVLDDADRTFVYHVETAFRDRGLRSDVIILSPRLKLSAVVRRQVIEGVMAVVKVSRTHQYTRKISLQVFDRTGGSGNIRFNEYSEVELQVAADVVVHAQNTQRGASNTYQVQPFVGPQLPPQQPQQPIMPSMPGPNNISNLISTLDGPGLQSLLGALQRTPATVQAIQQRYPPSSGSSVDLASLLTNLSRQPNPPQSVPQTSLPYGPMPNPAFGQDSNLLSMLSKGITQPNTHQQQQQQQPHSNAQVQNIMDQLAKWQSK